MSTMVDEPYVNHVPTVSLQSRLVFYPSLRLIFRDIELKYNR